MVRLACAALLALPPLTLATQPGPLPIRTGRVLDLAGEPRQYTSLATGDVLVHGTITLERGTPTIRLVANPLGWPASPNAVASAAQPAAGALRPFKGRVHVIPGTIEAEDFDEGGEGVAYHDTDPVNQEKKGPPYRESGVDLEWRPEASGQYNLGWTRAGEWLVYSVDVRETGTYRVEMMVASEATGGTFHIEFDGVDRTGPIVIPDTGGWEHLKPLVKEGVRLEAGRRTMKVVMDTDGESGSTGDIDFFRFVRP